MVGTVHFPQQGVAVRPAVKPVVTKILSKQDHNECWPERQISQRAGINISTLYRYFDDKYNLVEGLLTRFTNLQLSQIEQEISQHTDPGERLGYILDLQLKMLLDHPWLSAVQDALRASPRLQEIRRQDKVYLTAMVRKRKVLMRELKTMLNAYLETMTA